MSYLIVFDTETTGATHEDKPCQIAVALVSPNTLTVVDSAKSFINPEREIKHASTKIHGITQDMVQGAPTLSEFFAQRLSAMFAQADLVCGHNVAFDIRMCAEELKPFQFNILDTLEVARLTYPKMRNHKLQTLVDELMLPSRLAHDAMGDVQSCLDFLRLVSNGRSAHQIYYDTKRQLSEAKQRALGMGAKHA